jgi:hypothetical protein
LLKRLATSPEKTLSSTITPLSFESVPIVAGRGPVIKLLERKSNSKETSSLMHPGIRPLMPLKASSNVWSWCILQISVGIDPTMELVSIEKSSRVVRAPISDGIDPTRLLESVKKEMDGISSELHASDELHHLPLQLRMPSFSILLPSSSGTSAHAIVSIPSFLINVPRSRAKIRPVLLSQRTPWR